jgi:hypothetical protein
MQPTTAVVRPLFRRWATTLMRLSIALAIGAAIAIPTLLVTWARSAYATGEADPIAQPILFDHRHHVRDDGIDCTYCHSEVERSPSAGIPGVDLCAGCHGQIWRDAPLLSAVRRTVLSGGALRWARVGGLPDFVFFHHAAHVRRGVGCVSCHGRVDRMGQVYQATPLTMDFCLDCHRAPERFLRPAWAITDMEYVPERPQLEVGRALRDEMGIAPPLHCSGCHR